MIIQIGPSEIGWAWFRVAMRPFRLGRHYWHKDGSPCYHWLLCVRGVVL